ncbi:hypothetical protein MAR_026574, partial [Mya arenaria]
MFKHSHNFNSCTVCGVEHFGQIYICGTRIPYMLSNRPEDIFTKELLEFFEHDEISNLKNKDEMCSLCLFEM